MRIGGIVLNGQFLVGPFFTVILGLTQQQIPAQEMDLSRTRKIAETQHEIVMILIKKKEFEKAAAEANKIFNMNWPDDQAPVLKDELLRLSDLFRHNNQPEIALRLLDTHVCMFKSTKIQAELLKDKAYLLEGMGRHDQALDNFREAKRLLENKDLQSPCADAVRK